LISTSTFASGGNLRPAIRRQNAENNTAIFGRRQSGLTEVTSFVALPFITDDGIAAGLSQRQREFFQQPRCSLVDDDGDIPSFACPHPRFRKRYQRTVSLHSHRFTFLFRNNFKPHVNSPTLYSGDGRRWICPQFANTMSGLRVRTAEIGRVSAALICPSGKSAGRWWFALSSPPCKNISVFPKPKSGYMICHPPHLRGVSRSSRTRGWMRWTRQRRARNGSRGAR
jgi:hypothetical protein